MTDPANRLSVVSRAGSLRLRPNTPLGPRVRNRSSNLLETGLSPLVCPSDSGASSPNSSLLSPVSPLTPPRLDHKSLPVITEVQVPVDTLPVPAYDENPPMSPSQPSFKPVATIPKLATPPSIKFDSIPVPWKALPLEAALWTFNSHELQHLVSRAIRSSASESFIRLLSVDNLDNVLPAELDRLISLKGMTQSKYRFLTHRRTMLIQALNSNSAGHSNKDGEEAMSVVSKLTVQLSEIAAESDQLVEDIVKITDQITQIQRMLDLHWASALAIALRKLNGSYGRRTTELVAAKDRISQLEAELEDAWKEAEKMAREMDEYEAALGSDDEGEAIIETAEIVSVPQSPISSRRASIPLAPTIFTLERGQSFSRVMSTEPPPVSFKGPMRWAENGNDASIEADVPDTVSIRSNHSAKSTRSHRSTRSIRGGDSRIAGVSAARKRSFRASQGSLRLPTHSRKNSNARPKTPHDDQPPLPIMPVQFTPGVVMPPSANASSALLHESKNTSTDSNGPAQPNGQLNGHGSHRTSLDSLGILGAPQQPTAPIYPTVDDIYLRHRYDSDDEIQEVSRAMSTRASSLDRIRKSTREVIPAQDIPSIWMQADAPKTPAERVESLMGTVNSKITPYQKLRTLTKRYSLPFPVFSANSKPGSKPVSKPMRSSRETFRGSTSRETLFRGSTS